MQVLSRVFDNVLYINIDGELDECSANYFKNSIDSSILNFNFQKVIVDLTDLSFMDSTGIGVLIGRYKILRDKRIPIFIVNPNKQVDKIFNMAGLYEIMPKIS